MSAIESPSIVAAVTTRPLDAAGAIAEVSAPGCGAIASFVGVVRTSPAAGETNSPVVALEYDAHEELATARLEEIARAAAEKWNLHAVHLEHRIGRCAVGEPTVVVACASPHRGEALDACRHIIDTVKSTVPIWKNEIYEDGSAWVGADGEAPAWT